MINIIPQGSGTNLESTRPISTEQANAIKTHAEQVKAYEKDFHFDHTIVADEDGSIYSKVGRSFDEKFDPIVETEKLKNEHSEFLKWVDTLLQFKEDKGPAQPYSLEEVQKKIHELKDDLAKHGVGLCGVAYLDEHAAYFGFLPIEVFAMDAMEKAFSHEDTKD